MAKVTGLGGVFISTEHNKELKDWLKDNLNLGMQDWGGVQFFWRDNKEVERRGSTVLNFADASSECSTPSTLPVILNFRVDNLEEMLNALSQRGIAPVKKYEDSPYGRFADVLAPGGLKIQLWEPSEEADDDSAGDV